MQQVETHILNTNEIEAICVKASGIYQILNSITKDFYIGSSCDLIKRKNRHTHGLRKGTHVNRHLQNAYNKYGEGNFVFIILEYCTQEELLNKEQWYIDTLSPIYNKRNEATSNKGLKYNRTKEHNIKISNSLKGVKRSIETKDKFRNNNLGKVLSNETRLLISEKLKEIQAPKIGIKRNKTICDKIKKTKLLNGMTENQKKSRSKPVKDINTGVIYESAKYVSELLGISHSGLMRKLNGGRNNNTIYIYAT